MARRQSRVIGRYPWARHHYPETHKGYDKGCHACDDAVWTIDLEYIDDGQRWKGAACAEHDPGSPEPRP